MIITRARARVGKLRGVAHVDGQLVAEAEITFTLVDRAEASSTQ